MFGNHPLKMHHELFNESQMTDEEREEKFRNRYVFKHIPQNVRNTCSNEHNAPEKPMKKKCYKSAFQVLIERNKLKPKNSEVVLKKVRHELIFSKKKINDILNIAKILEDSQNISQEKRKSLNPFITHFGKTNTEPSNYTCENSPGKKSILMKLQTERSKPLVLIK